MRLLFPLLSLALAACATMRDSPIADPDTRAWWETSKLLSSDSMEGRDTGSSGYDRAAGIVADDFRRQGLLPAGDGGSYFQRIQLHESRVDKAGTRLAVIAANGGRRELDFLHDWSIRPTDGLAQSLSAPIAFRGYCSAGEMGEVAGKAVVCFNTRRTGMPTGAQRMESAIAGRAAALINVDDPYFTIEPPRWPVAYARTVAIAGTRPPPAPQMPVVRLNSDAFGALVAGSGRDPAALLRAGGSKAPLPGFDVPARIEGRFALATADYASKNVLGLLPGTDPRLAAETLVLGAHLDGYGYGEPVQGDNLYNGTLDDAAYVALLMRLAERRHGQGYRRPVLFAAFTGEEKGLLGSNYFVQHPTVPLARIGAMINLDQLRPLFPLDILTVMALDESTLGDTVRQVAGAMAIRVQADPEPERGLLQRADHWPFMQSGVPATGFVFGFEPGTEAERRYRLWYMTRYHHPKDDSSQPMDFAAAARFDAFFYRLVEAVADGERRPEWRPGSRYSRR